MKKGAAFSCLFCTLAGTGDGVGTAAGTAAVGMTYGDGTVAGTGAAIGVGTAAGAGADVGGSNGLIFNTTGFGVEIIIRLVGQPISKGGMFA